MSEIKYGFEPIYNNDSRVLILGSFPSVKSRQVEFYYGNKQNRFWRMISQFFGEEVPETVECKRQFLYRHHIALWDMVHSCQIKGSSDATIENYTLADIPSLLGKTKIQHIILNGALAFALFEKNYSDCGIFYERLNSTSPANPKFTKEEWFHALSRTFARVE